jgi:hypothetical protein
MIASIIQKIADRMIHVSYSSIMAVATVTTTPTHQNHLHINGTHHTITS